MNVSDGKKVTIKKGLASKLKVGHESPKELPLSNTSSKLEEKLDRLYDVMNHIRWIGDKTTFAKLDYICKTLNHIRWIGLSIGCMFALTFIVPQCTGS